jgi:hypothetical protein
MTRDTDIERVLDRFYAEGPSEMPDRLLLGVFDRIERVPQRRLAAQMTRFTTMSPNFRLAAAAAIVVALVGIGAFAFSRMSNVASPPTPSPSRTASPTASAGASEPLPVVLHGRWVGAPRVVPTLPEPPIRNALVVSDSQLGFAVTGAGSTTQKQLASVAARIAPDQLRLRGASSDGGCVPGNEGTYTFTLSNLDTLLTLTPISDACGPRAAALAGEWTRVGCTDDEGWCLGELAPGTHDSVVFTPFVPPDRWQFDYGRFSYTVPAGWENIEDCPGCYALAKQGAPENAAIFLFSDVVPHSQDESCPGAAEPGVGRTASEITDWLASLPGFVAPTAEAVTVGGLSGFRLDLEVAADWAHTCSYSEGNSLVSTFVDSDDKAEGFDWNVGEGSKARYFLLDLGDGRTLLISIEAPTTADFDSLVVDAMPVIETFAFRK